jgi:hypothetical protein
LFFAYQCKLNNEHVSGFVPSLQHVLYPFRNGGMICFIFISH